MTIKRFTGLSRSAFPYTCHPRRHLSTTVLISFMFICGFTLATVFYPSYSIHIQFTTMQILGGMMTLFTYELIRTIDTILMHACVLDKFTRKQMLQTMVI